MGIRRNKQVKAKRKNRATKGSLRNVRINKGMVRAMRGMVDDNEYYKFVGCIMSIIILQGL